MEIAARNRAIKKVVEQAFGKCKVSVRGSRGTAYGWVRVHISHSPRNYRERRELESLVSSLISSAKINVGTYGYDDPGSDYGFGSKIHIDFDACRETADGFGPDAWKQHMSAEDWDAMQKEVA
jgi:hypothetical protein